MNTKLTFRILAAVVVATTFVVGINAQTNGGAAMPGVQADYASTTTQGATYVVEGDAVPLYATPDPYYHPNNDPWNATPDYTLTAGFTWEWSEGTGTLTFGTNSANDNYTVLTAPAGSAAGSPYTVNVQETSPAAYGGCSDAGIDLTVNVVLDPSITIDGGDATYAFCEGNAGLPVDIQTTIADGWQNYRVVWNLEIKTLDASSNDEFWYDDENGLNPAGAAKYAVNYTTAAPQAIANIAASPDLMTVGSYLAINNGTRDAVTVYTYTLVSINDQASRYGDFIGMDGTTGIVDASSFNYNAVAAASDVVTVTIYPTPVTGPIFHISDAWAN